MSDKLPRPTSSGVRQAASLSPFSRMRLRFVLAGMSGDAYTTAVRAYATELVLFEKGHNEGT